MLYLAPESSLDLIRYLRSTSADAGLEGTPTRKKSLRDAINTMHALNELDETAQRWFQHAGDPIHVFVNDRSKGTSTKHLITHVAPQPLPTGTFLDLGHDICICTPQFTFLRMAATVDLIDAIRIGMEFCGFYSKWRLPPQHMDLTLTSKSKEERACTFGLPPVMQANQVTEYINRLAGYRGIGMASKAAKWLNDQSASPMESATYLLLCLPKRIGGYGLPIPILNSAVTLQTPEGKKVRHPDLFWPDKDIDVEYNSDQDHSGDWARYRDSRREIQLHAADVRTLPLTRHQLMDKDEFHEFAWILRRMLGVRARAMPDGWELRRDDLRERLLHHWKNQ